MLILITSNSLYIIKIKRTNLLYILYCSTTQPHGFMQSCVTDLCALTLSHSVCTSDPLWAHLCFTPRHHTPRSSCCPSMDRMLSSTPLLLLSHDEWTICIYIQVIHASIYECYIIWISLDCLQGQITNHTPTWYDEAIAHTAWNHACRKTTQSVDVEPFTIVQGPQDWVAADFHGEANAHKWQLVLDESDIAEIEAALKGVEDKAIKIEVCTSKILHNILIYIPTFEEQ